MTSAELKHRAKLQEWAARINDHPLRWQRVFCFLASQHRQYAALVSWSGRGGLPAVLTSETPHSRLTRWHLCLK